MGRFRLEVLVGRFAFADFDDLLVCLLALDFDLDDFDLRFVCLRAMKKVYTCPNRGQHIRVPERPPTRVTRTYRC